MHEVMDGEARSVQLAAFLGALAAKGVAPQELAGLADAMVDHAVPIAAPNGAVDIVGTGGDLPQTVNISTMASVVIAAAGILAARSATRTAADPRGFDDRFRDAYATEVRTLDSGAPRELLARWAEASQQA